MYLERGLVHDDFRRSPKVPLQSQGSGPGSGCDHFDRLPDSLLLAIFNKLADIKALGKCCAVSKRFYSLASQVDNVVVKVDCVISGDDSNMNAKAGRGLLTNLVRLVCGSILKPFQALQQFLAPKRSKSTTEVSHHSPGEVLRNFKEIQKLRIELPGGELGIEEDIVLKWKAEFGSTVESCVLLGAYRDKKVEKCDVESMLAAEERIDSASRGEEHEVKVEVGGHQHQHVIDHEQQQQQRVMECQTEEEHQEQQEIQHQRQHQQQQEENGSIPESFYTDGSLKSRVVWTISSLIAASARHFLLQQIISEHPTLDSLVLTDADGQGTLTMSKQQLEEFRTKPLAASGSSNRTQVPALNMKLWYAPYLRLSDGSVLRGATLVAIRPSDRPPHKDKDLLQHFIAGAFEEPYRSAAALLVKRRTYLLEMNSF